MDLIIELSVPKLVKENLHWKLYNCLFSFRFFWLIGSLFFNVNAFRKFIYNWLPFCNLCFVFSYYFCRFSLYGASCYNHKCYSWGICNKWIFMGWVLILLLFTHARWEHLDSCVSEDQWCKMNTNNLIRS